MGLPRAPPAQLLEPQQLAALVCPPRLAYGYLRSILLVLQFSLLVPLMVNTLLLHTDWYKDLLSFHQAFSAPVSLAQISSMFHSDSELSYSFSNLAQAVSRACVLLCARSRSLA